MAERIPTESFVASALPEAVATKNMRATSRACATHVHRGMKRTCATTNEMSPVSRDAKRVIRASSAAIARARSSIALGLVASRCEA
jgi:hypothetical protein